MTSPQHLFNDSSTRWALGAALAISLVFALTRSITVICRAYSVASASPTGHLSARSSNATFPARVRPARPVAVPALQPAVAKAEAEVVEFNGLPLNSNFRTYQCSFAGRVTCEGKPCSAELHVTLVSNNNAELRGTFQTEPDGSYDINLPIREIPREQVDWKLSAARGPQIAAEARGRQILTEDSGLAVDQSFNFN